MLVAVWHVRCTDARQGGARFQSPDQGETNHETHDGNRDRGIRVRRGRRLFGLGRGVANVASDPAIDVRK